MPDTYREQWQEAAAVLRKHAAEFDEMARTAPLRPGPTTRDAELVGLLHAIDGQLGLAVYRGEGGRAEWKAEATSLITRIRQTLRLIDGGGGGGSMEP
jgi:hypothetical protein